MCSNRLKEIKGIKGKIVCIFPFTASRKKTTVVAVYENNFVCYVL